MERKIEEYCDELYTQDIALAENRKRIETLEESLRKHEEELADVKTTHRIPNSDKNHQLQQQDLQQSREKLEMPKATLNEFYEKLHTKDEVIAEKVDVINEKVDNFEGLVPQLKMENMHIKGKLDEVLVLLRPKCDSKEHGDQKT